MRVKRARSRKSNSVKDLDEEYRSEVLPQSIAELPDEENKLERQDSNGFEVSHSSLDGSIRGSMKMVSSFAKGITKRKSVALRKETSPHDLLGADSSIIMQIQEQKMSPAAE